MYDCILHVCNVINEVIAIEVCNIGNEVCNDGDKNLFSTFHASIMLRCCMLSSIRYSNFKLLLLFTLLFL